MVGNSDLNPAYSFAEAENKSHLLPKVRPLASEANNIKPEGALKVALFIIGIVIGAWQGFISLQTIFVMRDEWLLLIALIIGPLSIIPAVVLSLWKPRLGGSWLIIAGIGFSVVVAAHSGAEMVQLQTAFLHFSLPMILLGVGFIWIAKRSFRNAGRPDSLVD